MHLREWQERARKAILGKGSASELFESARHFHVYRDGLAPRVFGVIRGELALLERLVGEQRLRALVREFLAGLTGDHADIGQLVPAFVAFLEGAEAAPTVKRAARLGLLEQRAAAAPEPKEKGRLFGLHPSAGLLGEGPRHYAVWREEGAVRRERIRRVDFTLLQCFREKAELAEISRRLEAAGLKPAFVQGSVAVWSNLGLIVSLA